MPARTLTSRTVVAALMVLTLTATASACSSDRSDSSTPSKTTQSKNTQPTTAAATNAPCTGPKGVGSAVPAGFGPGDLVGAVDLTAANQSSEGFPTDARVWRILYVSSGVDEQHLQLVCGLAAAPKAGPKSFGGGTGRMLAWAHGTVGVQAGCLPASDPAGLFWGKMPGGIGAPAWSTLLRKTSGQPEDGALQYAMDQGWVVAATDYQPETYVLGSIAAANVLDANRATAQLLAQQFSDAPADYDFVTWGHSQGGHSAIWAGQLAESYLAGTKPSKPTAGLHLVGVAAEAPASNFVAQPTKQSGVTDGNGLTDWEMHQVIGVTELPIAIPKLQVQIGPALFSYIFGSWNKVSAGPQPTSGAKFPAFPVGSKLDESSLITPVGQKTVDQVLPNCLTGSDAKKIQAAVGKYRHAERNQMLIPAVWNLPNDYSTGAYFHGGTDRACAEATGAEGLATWCSWIRWNLPGPAGVNPYPKAPIVDAKPVPMLIAQGEADTVIHCVPAKGQAAAIPAPDDCMSRALFDSLSSKAYCPADGGALGHLELDLFHKHGAASPATHFSVPGQIGSKGTKGAELTFTGSPLQEFLATAFDGSAKPGCTARVMNP